MESLGPNLFTKYRANGIILKCSLTSKGIDRSMSYPPPSAGLKPFSLLFNWSTAGQYEVRSFITLFLRLYNSVPRPPRQYVGDMELK